MVLYAWYCPVLPQALELQYLETVMMLYERLGLPEAASKFALAATKQVGGGGGGGGEGEGERGLRSRGGGEASRRADYCAARCVA